MSDHYEFNKFEDKTGQWRWRLVAGNGRIVADSAEGYATEANVDRAIEALHADFFRAISREEFIIIRREHWDAVRDQASDSTVLGALDRLEQAAV